MTLRVSVAHRVGDDEEYRCYPSWHRRRVAMGCISLLRKCQSHSPTDKQAKPCSSYRGQSSEQFAFISGHSASWRYTSRSVQSYNCQTVTDDVAEDDGPSIRPTDAIITAREPNHMLPKIALHTIILLTALIMGVSRYNKLQATRYFWRCNRWKVTKQPPHQRYSRTFSLETCSPSPSWLLTYIPARPPTMCLNRVP